MGGRSASDFAMLAGLAVLSISLASMRTMVQSSEKKEVATERNVASVM